MNLKKEIEIENIDSKINHILQGLINITHSHQCLPYVLNIIVNNDEPSIVSSGYLIYLLYTKKKEIDDIYNILVDNHASKRELQSFMSYFPITDKITDILNTNLDFEHASSIHQQKIEHYLLNNLPCPRYFSKSVLVSPLSPLIFTYSKTVLDTKLITSHNSSKIIHYLFLNIAHCPSHKLACQAFIVLISHYSNYFIAKHSKLTQAGLGKFRNDFDKFGTLQQSSISELANFYQKYAKTILEKI